MNCQHPGRRRTRSALYVAGDNEMSQGAAQGRKAVSPDNTVLGYRRGPKSPGCFGESYFRPVPEQVDSCGDIGSQQEMEASGCLGWVGSWPLRSGLPVTP